VRGGYLVRLESGDYGDSVFCVISAACRRVMHFVSVRNLLIDVILTFRLLHTSITKIRYRKGLQLTLTLNLMSTLTLGIGVWHTVNSVVC